MAKVTKKAPAAKSAPTKPVAPKKPAARKATQASAPAPEPRKILDGVPTPLIKGRARASFTSRAIDGRYNGWIEKPDGTRVERILVKDIAEAEDRAAALVAKGAL